MTGNRMPIVWKGSGVPEFPLTTESWNGVRGDLGGFGAPSKLKLPPKLLSLTIPPICYPYLHVRKESCLPTVLFVLCMWLGTNLHILIRRRVHVSGWYKRNRRGGWALRFPQSVQHRSAWDLSSLAGFLSYSWISLLLEISQIPQQKDGGNGT